MLTQHVRDCYGKELKLAIKRHNAGEAQVIPVILKSCLWNLPEIPFSKLNVLPDKAKPIASWRRPEEAFRIVAEQISRLICIKTTKECDDTIKPSYGAEGKSRGTGGNMSKIIEKATISVVFIATFVALGSVIFHFLNPTKMYDTKISGWYYYQTDGQSIANPFKSGCGKW